MFIVTVDFCEHFLEDHAPERLILCYVGEECDIVSTSIGQGSLLERHVVVDNDSMRYTKSVDVDSIDAVSIKMVIKENFFESLWLFR